MEKTLEQKKQEKRDYDKIYRAKNLTLIKERKAAYFKKTYDSLRASLKRKTPEYREKHKKYCAGKDYKEKYKQGYDKIYRAKRKYGESWEESLLLYELEKEIRKRATAYEIRIMHGNYNRAQREKRENEKLKRSIAKGNALGNIKSC